MGAALRLTNGFARIDRAWEWDQRSPLFGLRHQTAYLVWRKIVDQAGYPGCKSLGVGETHLSCADVAKMMGKCRSTISRAITYLSSNGLITTQKRGRRVYLFVPHYELTHDMDAYLGAMNLHATIGGLNGTGSNGCQKFHATIATAQNAQEKAAKNTEKAETQQFHATIDPSENQQAQNFRATIEVEPKQAKILEFDHALKSSRNNRNFHATIESDAVQDLNNEDHRENNCCTKGSKSFAQQSGAILKELTTKNINIIPATPIAHRCAQNEHNNSRKPEGSIEGRSTEHSEDDMAKGELTDFDIEIAEMWRDGLAEVDAELGRPPRRIKINDWAHVVRLLREQDGLSENAIYYMTIFRFEDEFYRTSGMGLGNLRSWSKNGSRKSDNLLDRARAHRDAQRARRANSDDLGTIVYGVKK